MPNRVEILGVPFAAVTLSSAVDIIKRMLTQKEQRHVMTPNSEMLVEASKNPKFHSLLNRTALNIPDSIGIVKAARRTGQVLTERVTGVDTVELLCKELSEEIPVFFLGAGEDVARRVSLVLKKRNPSLNVAGTFSGGPKPEDAITIIQKVNKSGAQLLLVAFGAPKQDLWIDRYLKDMPNVRVAMGVGGTFDFIAGVRTRAPTLFQKLGLEWLWRFLREPTRIKRIWNAVVEFPMLVFKFGKKSPL